MASKIRKQIDIEPHQENLLKAIAQQAGGGEAKIICQVIDLYISSVASPQPNLAAWDAERAFIDMLKNKPALPGGRDWRREDLFER